MPVTKLTDLTIPKLAAPQQGAVTYIDEGLPGFGVRVTANGVRSYVLVWGAQRKRKTLGKVGIVPLKDARAAARKLLATHTLGAIHHTSTLTFRQAWEKYEKAHLPTLRSARQNKQAIEKDAALLLGSKLLHAITEEDVSEVLNRIRKRGSEYQRTNTRAFLRAFFSWCMKVDNLGFDRLRANPAVEISHIKAPSRDRVLSDFELCAVWNGATKLPYPFGPFFQVLLLSGQRRDEVGEMQRRELAQRPLWTVPAERAKNNRIHEVPLSPRAWSILDKLPVVMIDDTAESPFVFTTTGQTPISGFTKARALLDKEAQAWLDRHTNGVKLAPFWLHDFRRTLSTKLAEFGYPQEVTEAVINHQSGKVSGVAAVYNRYKFMKERTAALAQWADYIVALAAPRRVAAEPLPFHCHVAVNHTGIAMLRSAE